MRKLILAAALALGGAALFSATPAQANVIGCSCATANHAPVCVATPEQCSVKMSGLCIAPCSLDEPKVMKHHKHKRHMHKAKKPKAKPAAKMDKKTDKKK